MPWRATTPNPWTGCILTSECGWGREGPGCRGGGFLLAVLWFDLMFDVQVIPHRGREVPEQVLTSIAAYYARVTTAARPMNRLVPLAMAGTLTGIVLEITGGSEQRWVAWASLAAVSAGIGLAGAQTVRNAVRLGSRRDSLERQSALARSVCRDHMFCANAIAVLVVLQVGFA